MLLLGLSDNLAAFGLRCGGSNTDIVALALGRILGECDKMALFASLFEITVAFPYGFFDRPAILLPSGFVCDGGGSGSPESDPSLLELNSLWSRYNSSPEKWSATRRVGWGFGFGIVGSWNTGCSLHSWTAGLFLRSTCFVTMPSEVTIWS